jgi:antitoxin ParD1/3/4
MGDHRGWREETVGVIAILVQPPLSYDAAAMKITLTSEQMAWIGARVARGEFPSADEAVRQLIDERIAERTMEDDDLSWAKPLVDRAVAEAERGDAISLDEHKARNAMRLDALRR